jgi:hypothetical protein
MLGPRGLRAQKAIKGFQDRSWAAQNTDRPSRLLCACRRHPRCRAAEKDDELAPSHGLS